MAGPQAVGFQLRSLLKFLAGADVVALALKSKPELPMCVWEIGIRSDCSAQLFDRAFDVSGGHRGGATGRRKATRAPGGGAGAAGSAAQTGGTAAGGASGPGAALLRRASQRVDGPAREGPSTAAILLLSGCGLLLLAGGASWRYRRRARAFGEPLL